MKAPLRPGGMEGPGPEVSLNTTHYILRTLTPQDNVQDWITWAADPEIMRPINTSPMTMSLAQVQNYIRSFDRRRGFLFGIFDKPSRKFIGFYQLKLSLKQKTVTFNVLIGDKSYWGKNAIIETRAALLDYFFDKMGMEKAIGLPLARNFPMIYNYKLQGWTMEGVLRGQVKSAYDGTRLDQYHFGLLRETWRQLRKGK